MTDGTAHYAEKVGDTQNLLSPSPLRNNLWYMNIFLFFCFQNCLVHVYTMKTVFIFLDVFFFYMISFVNTNKPIEQIFLCAKTLNLSKQKPAQSNRSTEMVRSIWASDSLIVRKQALYFFEIRVEKNNLSIWSKHRLLLWINFNPIIHQIWTLTCPNRRVSKDQSINRFRSNRIKIINL